MENYRKIAILVAVVVIAAIIVAIIWTREEPEGEVGPVADQEETLQVWIGGDKAYRGLAEVGKRFTEETGVEVIVEHPEDVPGKFQKAAAAGKGPDILIWPHDRLSEWAGSGLIAPIQPGPEVRERFLDVGLKAFTLDDRLWGYPISVEAIGLIYNKDLVADPPETFEEIPALHEQLARQDKRAILWAYTNPYFTWPLLAAQGGYVFGRTADGGYDLDDIGVDAPGAIQGARLLVDLIESGVMPRGVDYAIMDAEMARGNLGMMLNGPWAWDNLRKLGVDFGVAPIPSVGGAPAKPFVGVLGAMINRASPNQELAAEFLESYVLTLEGLQTLEEDVSLGVPADKTFFRMRIDDPLIRATMENVEQGTLMPTTPAMGRFWAAMTSALENIAAGRQSPEAALEAAAERIRSE